MRNALCAVFMAGLLMPAPARAYSVLAHEANVDAMWDSAIVPVLKRRFPRVTREELVDARAYAYGGCVIQDLGYYPFGSHFFSDLLHYVRSGDFVWRLIADAKDVNELAFGLGALAHYAADSNGHPLATNKVVPMMYPKLRAKYGDRVTYAQSPKSHVLVEFSFDVVQAASGVYASDAYHKFIGFKVAVPALENAFRATYGIEMRDLFSDFDLAIGTYRHAVSEIIPQMTKVAWRDRREEILKVSPQMQEATFVFHLTPREYAKDYGVDYAKPKWWARLLGVLFKLLPKIGPFAPLSFKVPTPEAEQLFLDSFNATQERYRALLRENQRGELKLPNLDLDTGYPARPGEYSLADQTCAKLVQELDKRGVGNASCNK
ncbi:MAG TPA: zinc dependent phospholipase C family protein [Vicinamibacterales bacterium]|nr:zinc dependent phospholipase C family protein [Vicinamibacterales bacterium]